MWWYADRNDLERYPSSLIAFAFQGIFCCPFMYLITAYATISDLYLPCHSIIVLSVPETETHHLKMFLSSKLCFFGRSKLNYQQWEQTSKEELAFCSSVDGYILIGNMLGIIRQFGLFPTRLFSPIKYNIRQSIRNRHFRQNYFTKMHEAEKSFIMLNAALNVNIVYTWMWMLTKVKYQKGVIWPLQISWAFCDWCFSLG